MGVLCELKQNTDVDLTIEISFFSCWLGIIIDIFDDVRKDCAL